MYPSPPPYPHNPYHAQPPTHGLSIASLVLGIVSLPLVFLCCTGYITGTLSIVFGVIALGAVRRGEASSTSRGLAWGGIVTSAVAMIGYAAIYLIYVIILGGALLMAPPR